MLSVIITTCNRSSYLETALNSVFMQDYENKEIIVIDDASTDDTSIVLNKFNINKCIFNTERKGVSLNHKTGYLLATGKYVVFMDDDDFYTDPKFFSKAINILDSNPELVLVGSNSSLYYDVTREIIKENLNILGKINGIEYFEYFQYKWKKPHSTFPTVFRKLLLDRANFPNMKMMNDSSIYLRALTQGDAYFLQDNVGCYRIHKTNITHTINFQFILDNLKEKLSILKEFDLELRDKQEWWYRQFRLTFDYFYESKHERKEERSILKWGLLNNNRSLPLIFFIIKRYIIQLFK